MRELGRTHLAEEVADVLGELRWLEPVIDSIAITTLAHQVRRFQDRQVARDGWAGDVKSTRDRARSELAILQFLKDLAASGISQSTEDACRVLHSFAI